MVTLKMFTSIPINRKNLRVTNRNHLGVPLVNRFRNDYIMHLALDDLLRTNNLDSVCHHIEMGSFRLKGWDSTASKFSITKHRLRRCLHKAIRASKWHENKLKEPFLTDYIK